MSLELIFILVIWLLVTLALSMFSDTSQADNKFAWLIHIIFVVTLLLYFIFPDMFAQFTLPFRTWIQQNLKIKG